MPVWSFLVLINLKTMYIQVCFKLRWKTMAQKKGNSIRNVGFLLVNGFRIMPNDCLCKSALQFLNTWTLLTVLGRKHGSKSNEWLILGDWIIIHFWTLENYWLLWEDHIAGNLMSDSFFVIESSKVLWLELLNVTWFHCQNFSWVIAD